LENITNGIDIRKKVIGQSVPGGDRFVAWLQDKVLQGRKDRECPPLQALHSHRSEEAIFRALKKATGRGFQEIRSERGGVRQIAMELLYRIGGLKGVKIGRRLGVDYSTVSQGRKRLRERMEKDPETKTLVERLKRDLSR